MLTDLIQLKEAYIKAQCDIERCYSRGTITMSERITREYDSFVYFSKLMFDTVWHSKL
jgi:hypothetical protein